MLQNLSSAAVVIGALRVKEENVNLQNYGVTRARIIQQQIEYRKQRVSINSVLVIMNK